MTTTATLAEDYASMRERLSAHADSEGGPMEYGRPERWWETFTVRCLNDHVSTRVLKTDRGDACLACRRGCALTFPEDKDGPLATVESRRSFTVSSAGPSAP